MWNYYFIILWHEFDVTSMDNVEKEVKEGVTPPVGSSLVENVEKVGRFANVNWGRGALTLLAVTVLYFTVFFNFAYYDVPSALSQFLIDDVGITHSMYGTIGMIYSVPNMVFPIVAGLIVDKVGKRKAYLGFFFLMALGSAIFAFGAAKPVNNNYILSYCFLAVGRFIFSFGADNGLLSTDVTLGSTVPSSLVVTAITVSSVIGRMGSVLTLNVLAMSVARFGLTPVMYPIIIWLVPVYMACIVGASLSYLVQRSRLAEANAALVKGAEPVPKDDQSGPVSIEAPEETGEVEEEDASQASDGNSDTNSDSSSDADSVASSSAASAGSDAPAVDPAEIDIIPTRQGSMTGSLGSPVPAPVDYPIVEHSPEDSSAPSDAEAELDVDHPYTSPSAPVSPLRRIIDAVYIPPAALMLTVCAGPMMGVLGFGWTAVGQMVLVERSGLAPEVAASYVSVSYFMCLISPLWAFIIDRIRKPILFMMFSSALSATAFTLLLLTDIHPFVAMIFQGFGFSFASPSCWSTVPFAVKEERLGMTYGLCSTFLNLFLGVTSVVVSSVVKRSWKLAIGWFIAAGIVQFCWASFFMFYDLKYNEKRLWAPPRKDAMKSE